MNRIELSGTAASVASLLRVQPWACRKARMRSMTWSVFMAAPTVAFKRVVVKAKSRINAVAFDREPCCNPPDMADRAEIRRQALKLVMARHKLTVNAWSKKAGLRESVLRGFLDGAKPGKRPVRGLNIETYERLAEAIGEPVQLLIVGEDSAVLESHHITPINRGEAVDNFILVTSNQHRMLHALGEDYAAVPVFDARVSAGPGAIYDGDGEPIHHHLYRAQWLREVTSSPPESLGVVRVVGDSMWETLHHGDHVLMDRKVRHIVRDGIYVLADVDSDQVQVKRISRDPRTRLLTIKSDNPSYESWPDVPDEAVRVEGLVIWLGRNVGG
jgi:SOS-response transcriptional repressor LexA